MALSLSSQNGAANLANLGKELLSVSQGMLQAIVPLGSSETSGVGGHLRHAHQQGEPRNSGYRVHCGKFAVVEIVLRVRVFVYVYVCQGVCVARKCVNV